MSKSFDKKQIGLAVACGLAFAILSGTAGAQNATIQPDAKTRLYVEDTRGTVVVSGYGLCWHSGFGPPPTSHEKCEPVAVAYVAPPAVKSEPVPAPVMESPPVAAPPRVEPPKVYEPPQRPAKRDRN